MRSTSTRRLYPPLPADSRVLPRVRPTGPECSNPEARNNGRPSLVLTAERLQQGGSSAPRFATKHPPRTEETRRVVTSPKPRSSKSCGQARKAKFVVAHAQRGTP